MGPNAEHCVVVGAFDEYRRAQAAVLALQAIGFSRLELGYVSRRGEVLEARGALAAVDAPEHDLAGGLIMHGVPVAEARSLWLELEGGRTIVMVQSPGGVEAAGVVLELACAASVQTWVRGSLRERTVPVHVRDSHTKTNSSNRAAATAFALRHGLA